MADRRWTILLEEEMPDPRESIAAHQRRQQPARVVPQARDDGQDEHAGGADDMQPTRGAVGVFGEVERIEISETAELAGHGLLVMTCSPFRRPWRGSSSRPAH